MANIDWNGHLEAYHTDGSVVPAWLDECVAQPDSEGDYSLKFAGKGPLMSVYRPDGLVWQNDHADDRAWRIRNVAEPAKPDIGIPMTDPIAKRMEALVQRMASERDYPCQALDWRTEARAIVALLPEPVDADLAEAREMAIDLMSKTVIANGNPQAAPEIIRIREGKGDTNSYVVACLAAIRRGRALERDSREG